MPAGDVAQVRRSPSPEEYLSTGSEHDAAAAGFIASVPSQPQGQAIAHNQLHEETVRRGCQAASHSEVACPLRPMIEINHGKKQLLLPAQRIKRGDWAYPAVVLYIVS